MQRWLLAALFLVLGPTFGHAANGDRSNLSRIQPKNPSPYVTPGTFCTNRDVDFAGYRYREQIAYCERKVGSSLRDRVYEIYRVPIDDRANYTIDHLVPLSLGGNNDSRNLWPEHRAIKALRQNLEYELYLRMEQGQISQRDAVRVIYEAKMNPPIEQRLLDGVNF
jgi:hypothetical protein